MATTTVTVNVAESQNYLATSKTISVSSDTGGGEQTYTVESMTDLSTGTTITDSITIPKRTGLSIPEKQISVKVSPIPESNDVVLFYTSKDSWFDGGSSPISCESDGRVFNVASYRPTTQDFLIKIYSVMDNWGGNTTIRIMHKNVVIRSFTVTYQI